MKGKTAFELAKPESPVMALLARHQVPNGQVSQHMSLELNGHHSTFQSICNRSNDGAASPVETESVFSTEEVKSNIQMSSCLQFLKNWYLFHSIDECIFAFATSSSTSGHHRHSSALAVAATQTNAAASRCRIPTQSAVDHYFCGLHHSFAPNSGHLGRPQTAVDVFGHQPDHLQRFRRHTLPRYLLRQEPPFHQQRELSLDHHIRTNFHSLCRCQRTPLRSEHSGTVDYTLPRRRSDPSASHRR